MKNEIEFEIAIEAAQDASTALGIALAEMHAAGLKPSLLLEIATESVVGNNKRLMDVLGERTN